MNALIIYLILAPIILGTVGFFASKKYPKLREVIVIGVNALEIIIMAILATLFGLNGSSELVINNVLSLGLSFKADAFRIVYAFITVFVWLMTITFSREYMSHAANKDRYYFFYMITLSGVLGVFFSNDLFTTYVFFEIMSIASYPLVIHDEKENTMKAGTTYISISIITGMVLLMGLFVLFGEIRSLSFEAIREYISINGVSSKVFASGLLMLVGFGAKAGMFPLHIWLPKAHPVAPAPASALLSGVLTKCGVFGVIIMASNIFMANEDFAKLLLAFAVITMFLGAVLALFSVDLKRTLACSSMSQIGFILTSLSFMMLLNKEGGIASQGAMLHMMNHSFIKLVLFMCAGVVAMNAHSLNLNDVKGYGRKKPFLMVIFLIGTLGIMGIPFFGGYTSKTMIHEGIVEYINILNEEGYNASAYKTVEWIFLISGGLTIAYMTKLFVCLFVEKNSDETKQKEYDDNKAYLSIISRVVFSLSAIAILLIGILPNVVGVKITSYTSQFFNTEEVTKVAFFSWECLKGAVISIVIGATVYLSLVMHLFKNKDGKYLDLWPRWLDLEYLVYRPILVQGTMLLTLYVVKGFAYMFDGIIWLLKKTILRSTVYEYNDDSLQHRIGLLIDRIKPRKDDEEYHAKKADEVSNNLRWKFAVSDFSFAMAMACIGLVIVILFAIFA